MTISNRETTLTNPPTGLRTLHVAYVPGSTTPLLETTMTGILRRFSQHGHQLQATPDNDTDLILTTAHFGQVVGWRQAVLLSGRRRFKLTRTPAVYTLVHIRPAQLEQVLAHFEELLAKDRPDPADYHFPGLAPQAYRVLFEQGRRGGPILALERMVQAQAKSIRILLVVGDDQPLLAYHFDLVGAYPKSEATDPESFYDDIVLRMVTTLSAREVTEHRVVGETIPRALWLRLSTPSAMCTAARELARRNFFTEMVRINDLVQVPAVADTVAAQYSEGCFSTWDPILGALMATVTGSARPVDKGNISQDDLAVIVGVRPDGTGALVRHVEGKRNDPPSSEAVEMMDMDSLLPTRPLKLGDGTLVQVPAARSKLHGHRGVAAYDPSRVEYVTLDQNYYRYLVSCATDAQARGIKAAFARSASLRNPADPRQIIFTVLPGHGAFIVEKWVPGAAPFEVMWQAMDAGYLQIESRIPMGPMSYVPGPDGLMVLRTE